MEQVQPYFVHRIGKDLVNSYLSLGNQRCLTLSVQAPRWTEVRRPL